MKKKYKKIIITFIVIIIVLIVTGGVYAYLTHTDQKTNVFTQGSVKISITEPNWNSTNGSNIRPGNVINKDPQINNIGKNEAYVYIKVEQPIVDLMTGTNGSLFSYTTNSGWTLLKTEECLDPNVATSIYYYNTALAKNTSTSKLFNSVTVNNYSQNFTPGSKDMVITGYAIQTRNLPSGTTIANAYNTYFGSSNNTTCNSKNIYRFATSNLAIGDNISSLTSGTDYVTDKSQLTNMNTNASRYYIKHKVTNNVITNSYVCFNVTSAMVTANAGMTAGEYCLEGGVGNTAYTTNRNILTKAFGPTHCTDFTNTYNCSVSGLQSNAAETGYVIAANGSNHCDVHADNYGSDCNGD